MAVLRFKRRAAGGAAGAPANLASAEPAVNFVDETLYVGMGDDGAGNATSVVPIGGRGAFVDKTSNQTIGGVKTFTSAPKSSVASNAADDLVRHDDARLSNARAPTTHSHPTSEITDLDTALAAKAPLASPALSGTPTAPTAAAGTTGTQLATLDFVATAVDTARQGLSAKNSVRAASTANVTVASPGTAIDGVTLANGDRVLLKDQTTASQNGVYVFNGSAAAMTRATDFDSAAEMQAGAYFFVEEGTANADAGFVFSTDGAITVGTTSLAFVQFSGAGQIAAGNGLTKTGNTINAVGTANRITVAADAIDIASTYVGQTSITTLGTVTTGTIDGGTF